MKWGETKVLWFLLNHYNEKGIVSISTFFFTVDTGFIILLKTWEMMDISKECCW